VGLATRRVVIVGNCFSQIGTERSPFQRMGKGKARDYSGAFRARAGNSVRFFSSFNQKSELSACVTVNVFICLELLGQVEMDQGHTG